MWDDGARGGTACQRARLDPGIGPVRNRVEGSNPRPGKGVETIPQAAPAGHRRKNRGRGPAKLLALKIAEKRFPPRTRGRELAKLCRRGTNDTTPLCLRFALGLGQGCQACCAMSITSGFNFWLARQASMIALNGDEIGGLPSTQDLPFAEFLAGLTRTRGSVLFFPAGTREPFVR